MLPPCTPVNERFVALRPIVGVGAAVIDSVTETACGVLVAPAAAIITAPVWLPIESPLILAPTENDPLFVPEAALPPFTVSQGIEEVAVHVSVPEPLLVTVRV